ncbi:tRNA-specific adenosine deaminase 1 [Golovinomyces cichoracearum]|uniref:tRNA-specific adenosine deaminase 1 n=1 Tax=Golovinomyces cichoracearum TaxID=62708 RepID=A0A420HPP9_9PEZI|nr:tRNA-specific adenosine deaminase 1 [Golovinomyces cichoracearum]
MEQLSIPDTIAKVVQEEFDKWPKKRHPLIRSETSKEWVPLSGIVVQRAEDFTCVAAATGMKCLPKNKIVQAQGVTLHDWHAEILALRSLNRFLLDECLVLLAATSCQEDDGKNCTISKYLRRRTREEITESDFQPFSLRDDILLHMYCSEAPCGDASMELTMAAQRDSTPWEISAQSLTKKDVQSPPILLHGRSYFSQSGSIRGKPSRPDAPPALSKSCSDKLALKQSTSLLSSITSLLISPKNVYLNSLVVPISQFSKTACDRAFSASGRLNTLQQRIQVEKSWLGGYNFQPFIVYPTSLEFKYSRRQSLKPNESLSASNNASFWTPYSSGTIIGGTCQGRRQFSHEGAPPMCKRHIWKLALSIARLVGNMSLVNLLSSRDSTGAPRTYAEIKRSGLMIQRQKVKSIVRTVLGAEKGEDGWVRNLGGDDWSL